MPFWMRRIRWLSMLMSIANSFPLLPFMPVSLCLIYPDNVVVDIFFVVGITGMSNAPIVDQLPRQGYRARLRVFSTGSDLVVGDIVKQKPRSKFRGICYRVRKRQSFH